MKVNIHGLDKIDVLLALYNNAKCQGKAYAHSPSLSALSSMLPNATRGDVDSSYLLCEAYWDRVNLGSSGERKLNVRIDWLEDTFEASDYDEYHGPFGDGYAESVIAKLRLSLASRSTADLRSQLHAVTWGSDHLRSSAPSAPSQASASSAFSQVIASRPANMFDVAPKISQFSFLAPTPPAQQARVVAQDPASRPEYYVYNAWQCAALKGQNWDLHRSISAFQFGKDTLDAKLEAASKIIVCLQQHPDMLAESQTLQELDQFMKDYTRNNSPVAALPSSAAP